MVLGKTPFFKHLKHRVQLEYQWYMVQGEVLNFLEQNVCSRKLFNDKASKNIFFLNFNNLRNDYFFRKTTMVGRYRLAGTSSTSAECNLDFLRPAFSVGSQGNDLWHTWIKIIKWASGYHSVNPSTRLTPPISIARLFDHQRHRSDEYFFEKF